LALPVNSRKRRWGDLPSLASLKTERVPEKRPNMWVEEKKKENEEET
jgi:hypothetical protein